MHVSSGSSGVESADLELQLRLCTAMVGRRKVFEKMNKATPVPIPLIAAFEGLAFGLFGPLGALFADGAWGVDSELILHSKDGVIALNRNIYG